MNVDHQSVGAGECGATSRARVVDARLGQWRLRCRCGCASMAVFAAIVAAESVDAVALELKAARAYNIIHMYVRN